MVPGWPCQNTHHQTQKVFKSNLPLEYLDYIVSNKNGHFDQGIITIHQCFWYFCRLQTQPLTPSDPKRCHPCVRADSSCAPGFVKDWAHPVRQENPGIYPSACHQLKHCRPWNPRPTGMTFLLHMVKCHVYSCVKKRSFWSLKERKKERKGRPSLKNSVLKKKHVFLWITLSGDKRSTLKSHDTKGSEPWTSETATLLVEWRAHFKETILFLRFS